MKKKPLTGSTLTISVIGAGSFGTAIAKVIAENHPDRTVTLWSFEKNVTVQINTVHVNETYLPGISLPANILAVNSIQSALSDADAVLITVPSKSFTEVVSQGAPHFKKGTAVALMSKGFAKVGAEYMTMSRAFAELAPDAAGRLAGIYGPSHSIELCRKFHTALIAASKDEDVRRLFCALLENDYLALRESSDLTGCEIGGALKNPVAIAAGVLSMIPGCGDNINGVLISQGFTEIMSLAKALGAQPESLYGISGLGDLVCTAFSEHGRNRQFGRELFKEYDESGSKSSLFNRIARGIMNIFTKQSSVNPKFLAEGIYAITPIIEIAEKNGLELPLFSTVYDMIRGKADGAGLLKNIKYPDGSRRPKRTLISKILESGFVRLLLSRLKDFLRKAAVYFRRLITRKEG